MKKGSVEYSAELFTERADCRGKVRAKAVYPSTKSPLPSWKKKGQLSPSLRTESERAHPFFGGVEDFAHLPLLS